MSTEPNTKLLPLSLIVALVLSWIVFCAVWFVAFSAPDRSMWTGLSDQFEHTILLWRAGAQLRAMGVMHSPAPFLIAVAPLFPAGGLILWSVKEAITDKSPRPTQPAERTFIGLLFALLIPVAVIVLEAHVIQGLPWATRILGPAALHASKEGLVYASVAILAMSAAIIATIVQANMANRAKATTAR